MPYTCPRCGRTSHNRNDEEHRYCGACHLYEDETTQLERVLLVGGPCAGMAVQWDIKRMGKRWVWRKPLHAELAHPVALDIASTVAIVQDVYVLRTIQTLGGTLYFGTPEYISDFGLVELLADAYEDKIRRRSS